MPCEKENVWILTAHFQLSSIHQRAHLETIRMQSLIHWGKNEKMISVLQMVFSNTFSWAKIVAYWLKFDEICYEVPNWQKAIIGSDNGLAPNRRQVIIWINNGLVYDEMASQISGKWTVCYAWLVQAKNRENIKAPNPPVSSGMPLQGASNGERIFLSRHHHDYHQGAVSI